ncbi:MAG: Glu/Leu/Phe/Val dehydrogenase dimerization domain-containing protein [Gemmatimonadota bacterium]|nr:Glu/Leu/Phe/Val dehydrogenase dimerization domain-containing protein [Gemmatimonadota bacterium]
MTEPGAAHPMEDAIWQRYAAYLSSAPELVVEWNDPESNARGWLVVNSLRGGAAGGGTRMRVGLTRDEVQYLAKVMELKFSISGPPVGGAKSGIDFDPDDPRKSQVLRRWFRAIRPLLEHCYSTAGDLNVDEVREVLPACRELGLHHPQQGLARGHLGLSGEGLATRLDALRVGLGQTLTGPMGLEGVEPRVADVVTGFSVATAGLRLYERQGRSLEGVRILVEGFGRVGGAAALYLARWGARIVGIVDDRQALVSEEGLDDADIEDLLRRRKGNRLPQPTTGIAPASPRARFGEIPADMIVCAAASGTVDYGVLDRLERQGVTSILCGANHPFAAVSFGDTAVEQAADSRFAVVADFICNLGTAHAFAVQLGHDEPVDPIEILDSIEMTVCSALDEAIVRAGSPDRGLLGAALHGALNRVSGRDSGESAGD